MNRTRLLLVLLLATLLLTGFGFYRHGRSIWVPVKLKLVGRRSVEDVLKELDAPVRRRLRADLAGAGFKQAPLGLELIAFKEERRLELWGRGHSGAARYIKTWPILAASGKAGPKLREGDHQVPEGRYRITGLNPNSSYHLSLKINFPNEFDRARGRAEQRAQLGSNIFLHGKAVSVGCLALGDAAIEELFVLAAGADLKACRILIAPRDFRVSPWQNAVIEALPWTRELYRELDRELQGYRRS